MRYCVVILLALAIHGSSASWLRDVDLDDTQNENPFGAPFDVDLNGNHPDDEQSYNQPDDDLNGNQPDDDQNDNQPDDDQNYDRMVDQLDEVNQIKRMALAALKLRNNVTVGKRSTGFSMKSCASYSALADVNYLEIPDTLYFPGSIHVTAYTYLKQSLPSPIKMKVTLSKKIGCIWLPVPCVGKLGSCTFNDICPIVPQLSGMMGINLNCPITAGTHSVDNLATLPKLPTGLPTAGRYWIRVNLSRLGQQIACVEAYFNIG